MRIQKVFLFFLFKGFLLFFLLEGYGNHMRWQIATANMKVGDLLTTTTKIPPNPVRPVEGNGYPLGALPGLITNSILFC